MLMDGTVGWPNACRNRDDAGLCDSLNYRGPADQRLQSVDESVITKCRRHVMNAGDIWAARILITTSSTSTLLCKVPENTLTT